MTTKGNLELRLPGKVFQRGVQSDGYTVFNAIVELAAFHDSDKFSEKAPTYTEFGKWFDEMCSRVFAINKDAVEKRLVGGIPYEVIIDATRRIVLHNGSEGHFAETGTDNSLYTITGAISRLERVHNYQFLTFESPSVRKMEAEKRAKEEARE